MIVPLMQLSLQRPAIVVNLFSQTQLADVEMLYIKENLKHVWRAGWSTAYGQHTHLSRCTGRHIALAAAYALAVAYRMQYHRLDCLQSSR
jgi:hypothetical protein